MKAVSVTLVHCEFETEFPYFEDGEETRLAFLLLKKGSRIFGNLLMAVWR